MLIRDFPGTMRWYRYKLYYSIFSPKNEIEQAYKAWGIAGNSPYPYVWKKEYDEQHYEVNVDNTNGLPYVVHNGKKTFILNEICRHVPKLYIEDF